ncbi:Calcium channel flower [Tyrophagus putrescentiae]|nr:Calcium channel flower [Tyrophagus putrescentiae]
MYPNVKEVPMDQPPPQQPVQSSWWTNKLATLLALVLFLCGVITLISVTPAYIFGGVLQILCALVILSIEAPVFVPCLGFAQPIGSWVDRKPFWLKSVLYLTLTLLPFILCSLITGIPLGAFFILGAITNTAIFAIYGRLVLGSKADRNAMRAHTGPANGAGGGVFP